MRLQVFLNISYKALSAKRFRSNGWSDFQLDPTIFAVKPKEAAFIPVVTLACDRLRFCACGYDLFNRFQPSLDLFVRQALCFIECQVDVLGKTLDRAGVALAERSTTFENTAIRLLAVSELLQRADDIIVPFNCRLWNMLFLCCQCDQLTEFSLVFVQLHKVPPFSESCNQKGKTNFDLAYAAFRDNPVPHARRLLCVFGNAYWLTHSSQCCRCTVRKIQSRFSRTASVPAPEFPRNAAKHPVCELQSKPTDQISCCTDAV